MLIEFAYPESDDYSSGTCPVDLFFVECQTEVALDLIDRFDLYTDDHHRRGLVLSPGFSEDKYIPLAEFFRISEEEWSHQKSMPVGGMLYDRSIHPYIEQCSHRPSIPMHRMGDVERVGFRVARDLSSVAADVLHRPYHQMYNGWSPWWQLPEALAISDLSELSDIEWVPGMLPCGNGINGWRPPDWAWD